jgi:hypothetical protein
VPIALSPAARRQLNVFFSNFAEVSMPPFRQGRLTDEAMIRFANRHAVLNEQAGQNNIVLTAERADALCLRYFGKKVARHRTVDGFWFKGKRYQYETEGDGEGPSFAQIDQLTRLSPYLYQALTTEYWISSGSQFEDFHAPPAAWRGHPDDLPHLSRRMRCLVRKTTGRDSRYVLVEYLPR